MMVAGDFVESEQNRSKVLSRPKVLRKSGYPSMRFLAQLQRGDGSGNFSVASESLWTADRCE